MISRYLQSDACFKEMYYNKVPKFSFFLELIKTIVYTKITFIIYIMCIYVNIPNIIPHMSPIIHAFYFFIVY